eukprot:485638-Rhodomonas_salina.1
MELHACYGMSATDRAYGATACCRRMRQPYSLSAKRRRSRPLSPTPFLRHVPYRPTPLLRGTWTKITSGWVPR